MPQDASIILRNPMTMGTLSPESLIIQLSSSVFNFSTSVAWPLISGAIYVPIEITYPVTITRMMVTNGAVVAGTIDVGIYDLSGSRLVSSGPVTHSGTSTTQMFDIPDTYLLPGAYYMGVSISATGTLAGFSGGQQSDLFPLGMYQQSLGLPLPASASFTMFSGTFVPIIGMTPQTTL